MSPNAAYWIAQLNMTAHPEGGYFAETYRSSETIAATALPKRYAGDRNFSTAIYFLVEAGNPSNMHRLQTDEIWHFYAGSPLELVLLHPDGTMQAQMLGPDFAEGQRFQLLVPAGCWFGARVHKVGGYALVGCTMAPGFDFADFEMGNRDDLNQRYPDHTELIESLT